MRFTITPQAVDIVIIAPAIAINCAGVN
jgi:hypothetical protein